MIKNDFRYIIKRIIIGIGICLGLSFLTGCTPVFASEIVTTKSVYNQNSKQLVDIELEIDKTSFDSFFLDDIDEFKSYCNSYSCSAVNSLVNKLNNGDFNSYLSQYDYYILNDAGDYNTNRIIFFNSNDIHFMWSNSLSNQQNLYIYFTGGVYYQSGGYTNISSLGYEFRLTNGSLSRDIRNTNIFSGTISNINKKYISSNDIKTLILGKSLTSTILDLGIQRNFDDNNILSSVSFSPTFDNFDTTNFTYQYKIGNNNWLTITSNDVTFNVNQNTSVYFRIINNSDNSVVDSRVYTITQIGFYETNPTDYKVVYTSENKSVDSSSSSPNRTIDRVTINFEYFPKISNLKYQYQYVEEGSSLSDWIDMPSDDYERGYTTLVNGSLYNRILDSDDNVLYTSTFNVNSIGKLMIDDDVSWYSSLFKKIDYGSGIGSIFFLPVRLIESIQSNFSQSCTSYNLGSLFGTDLILPCIDIKSHIGSTLYNTIDLIFMGFIILSLIKFITSLYNRIVSLNFTGNDDGEGVLFL